MEIIRSVPRPSRQEDQQSSASACDSLGFASNTAANYFLVGSHLEEMNGKRSKEGECFDTMSFCDMFESLFVDGVLNVFCSICHFLM